MKNIFKKIIVFKLKLISKLVLKKYKPKIIAVTGSAGKTSTKDAIYTAVKDRVFVRKTEKSFNSEIGIPLTILGLPNAWGSVFGWIHNLITGFLVLFKNKYPEWLILEIGADRPGDIKEVISWIRPDVSVVTRVGEIPVHVEYYDTPHEVAYEKSWLIRGLRNQGVAILNADDETVLKMKELTRAKIITVGFSEGSDFKASNENIIYDEEGNPQGITFRVQNEGSSLPISLYGTIGRGQIYPVIFGLVLGKELGINLIEVAHKFLEYIPPRGRMCILKGIHNTTIIDDSYNSSPVALEEGIKSVKPIKVKGKKIGVLGDMLELGRYSSSEHKRLGILASEVFDEIVCVGLRAKVFAEEAKVNGFKGEILEFQNSIEAGDCLKDRIKSGDLIYVKGSQGIRLEKCIEKILRDKERAKELLVRQEEEWMSR